jgi:hypothetical protein
VEHTRHVFGGQYIWLEATVSEGEQDITRVPGSVPELAQQFSASESRLKAHWKEKVDELVARGPVALWGAGAKGATFLNLLDADCRLISCVVDVNPRKQKHYIPGTGHPIVHYQELRNYEVKAAISMNPNYSSENLALLKEAHLDIDLVDLN